MPSPTLRQATAQQEGRREARNLAAFRQATTLAGRRPGNQSLVALTTHEAALDPHPTYLTAAEGAAAFDAIGSAAAEVAGHVAALDPHTQYLKEADAAAAYLPIALAASATPSNNGDIAFEMTSNTILTVRLKGSDGVVRSETLVLA